MTPMQRTRFPGILTLLTLTVVSAGTAATYAGTAGAVAWDGSGGTLAVIPWEKVDPGRLQPYQADSWLLSYSGDLAVLLLPEGRETGAPPSELTRLGPIRPDQTHYLYLVEDAGRARFEKPAEVLYRRGRTVLLCTPGDVPRLTAESDRQMHGLRQPVWIPLTPKAWPAPAAPATDGAGASRLTVFSPLVAEMVAQMREETYVPPWQSLDDFETRYTFTPQNEACALWLHDMLASYGLEAEFFEYEQSGTRKDVIGTLPGVVEPEKVVYMTSHFDSISDDATYHAPGADDNASGVASFLEAARVLSQYSFRYTIKFVGFDGEEQGYKGSWAYVLHLMEIGEDVVGCYNLDMVAYRGVDPDPPDMVIYSNEASLDMAYVLRDAALHYFPTELEPIVYSDGNPSSDHESFWAHGYKAVFEIEDEVFGDDFCPWIHTTEDRIERYPTDYPTHMAAAAAAAVAHTAIPVVPTGLENRPGTAVVRLEPAYPNPASGPAVFALELPVGEGIRLSIHDAGGRQVRVLASGDFAAGLHRFRWNGEDEQGRPVGSGIYWARVTDDAGASSTTRLVRVR
jgi:hypothetical protein